MVVVGGITRLTESGLSITEWNPVSGAIPPLTQADWQHEFDLYGRPRNISEVAGPAGMTLAGFKFIFFWEWVHRLLGRMLGLVFFAGVGWFAVKREIPKGYRLAPCRLVRPGRAAGRGRLVHGDVGARGPHRGQPLSSIGAPAVRLVPVRRADLDRARPARAKRCAGPRA